MRFCMWIFREFFKKINIEYHFFEASTYGDLMGLVWYFILIAFDKLGMHVEKNYFMGAPRCATWFFPRIYRLFWNYSKIAILLWLDYTNGNIP